VSCLEVYFLFGWLLSLIFVILAGPNSSWAYKNGHCPVWGTEIDVRQDMCLNCVSSNALTHNIILIILLILFFRSVLKNANIVDVMIEIWPPEAAGNCIYNSPGSRLLFSNLLCSLYLLQSTIFSCLQVFHFSSLQSCFCVVCSIFAPWRYSSTC
jgi:hypothetical protein